MGEIGEKGNKIHPNNHPTKHEGTKKRTYQTINQSIHPSIHPSIKQPTKPQKQPTMKTGRGNAIILPKHNIKQRATTSRIKDLNPQEAEGDVLQDKEDSGPCLQPQVPCHPVLQPQTMDAARQTDTYTGFSALDVNIAS